MRQGLGAAMRALGGIGVVAVLMTGVGSGLIHVGQALAGSGWRHADMVSAGVDPMPVGATRQVDGIIRHPFDGFAMRMSDSLTRRAGS